MNEDYFPFEYVGGGYYRQKGVPIGERAEMLHGQGAADYLIKKLSQQSERIAELEAMLTERKS